MANEFNIAYTWIYDQLKNDAPLLAIIGQYKGAKPNIHGDPAPEDALYPLVVIGEPRTATDIRGLGPEIIMVEMTVLVKVIVEGQSFGGPIAEAYDRIHALLHAKQSLVADGFMLGCVRVRPFRLPEFTNSRHYRHLGGEYRLYPQVQ